MLKVPLKNPSPDFETFVKVLKGEKRPEKVYFAELLVDPEIIKHIVENYLGEKYVPLSLETVEGYQKQRADFYCRVGMDYLLEGPNFTNLPQFKERRAQDTAALSRGERSWVEEGGGVVKNWDDFEKIQWDKIKPDLRGLDALTANLPDGMKVAIGCTIFEMIMERFLGYQDLFILSEDNPELVEAVFESWGQKVYDAYAAAIQYPGVGAIFHCDDLGFKTSTIMSPQFLRKNVFPWFKKYAALAHKHNRAFWLHSCGNDLAVMEDLIEDVKIDAFHSFQDVIIPVGEFMKRYGNRVGAMGGIDVDCLARLPEKELRKYVRKTLDECMPGRYALGSGNSVTNYVPPENYLAMLDEGLNWKG